MELNSTAGATACGFFIPAAGMSACSFLYEGNQLQ
jgi:hypothetical protein